MVLNALPAVGCCLAGDADAADDVTVAGDEVFRMQLTMGWMLPGKEGIKSEERKD